jgi:hypothetical protein
MTPAPTTKARTAPQRPSSPCHCQKGLTRRWRKGDAVRTLPSVRPARFAERVGTVALVRNVSPKSHHPIFEVGVVFRADSAYVWFWPEELERP